MKNKTLLLTALVCALIPLASCSKSDSSTQKTLLDKVLADGMIKITKNIGDWDVGVIYEKNGYIVLKEESEEIADESYLQIMSPDGDYDCALYSYGDSFLPQMLICDDETYFFDNVGDTLLVVTRANDEGAAIVDSLRYSISGASTKVSSSRQVVITYDVSYDDTVKKIIKALDAVLNAGEDYTSAQIRRLTKALDDISEFYYFDNVEEIIDSLDLCRETYEGVTDSLVYCFSQYATKKKIETYISATFGITVRNSLTATSVTYNSAKVGGNIYCASSDYRNLGTWGIIYSSTLDNLNLDNYEGILYTTANGFTLSIGDLKENTTYYFKAFYKFNSSDHGNLHFSYGDQNADSYVDSDWFAGRFTTSERKDNSYTGTINGHNYVDLGLSVKWATCNIGAQYPTYLGDYFAWGETSTKTEYTSENCVTRERDLSDIAGNPEYDAACANWGGPWRMPTKEEFEELLNGCDWYFERTNKAYYNPYRHTCAIITGPNGNSIILPCCAGRGNPDIWGYFLGEDYQGNTGYYWTSTPVDLNRSDEGEYIEGQAYSFVSVSAFTYILIVPHIETWKREYGFCIRPVAD